MRCRGRARCAAGLPLLALLCACETVVELPAAGSSRGPSSAAGGSPAAQARLAGERLRLAAQQVAAADERASAELAQLAPALIVDQAQDQRRAFVEAFDAVCTVDGIPAGELRAELVRAAAASGDALEALLATPAALRDVLDSDGHLERNAYGFVEQRYDAQRLLDDAAQLAQTPFALPALRFAVRAVRGDPALAIYGRQPALRAAVIEQVLVPALPAALLDRILASDGDVEQALAVLQAELAPLSGDGEGERLLAAVAQLRAQLGAAALAPGATVGGHAADEGLQAMAAVLAIWTAGRAVGRLEARVLLEALVRGGPSGAAALARALRLLRVTVLGRSAAQWGELIGRHAAVIGGGVAVVLNAIALVHDLQTWETSPAHIARVLADGLAIAGGVAAILGASGIGIGAAVAVLALRWLADYLQQRAVAQQQRADKRAALLRMGFAPELAATLAAADAEVLALLGQTGVPPATVQLLAELLPHDVMADGHHLLSFAGLPRAQAIFDLDAAELARLVAAVAGDGARDLRAGRLLLVLNWMERDPRFGPALCPPSALQLIAQARAEMRSAAAQAAMASLQSYLAAHLPAQAAVGCQATF